MWNLIVPLITTVAVVRPAAVTGVQPTENYRRDAAIDINGDYLLFWNFNDTHVTFEAHVKTRGRVFPDIS